MSSPASRPLMSSVCLVPSHKGVRGSCDRLPQFTTVTASATPLQAISVVTTTASSRAVLFTVVSLVISSCPFCVYGEELRVRSSVSGSCRLDLLYVLLGWLLSSLPCIHQRRGGLLGTR